MRIAVLISVFLVLPFLNSCQTESEFSEFTIMKGVNASHWLSQSGRRGTERLDFFTREDVDLIASLGYDHIRIPVDEEQLWDEDGKKETEAFELLHNAINWCKENDLRVVFDLHIIRSHYFNDDVRPLWTDPKEQDKMVVLWKELSEELRVYPNGLLAYELMNEAVADNPDDWNKLIARLISSIRKEEPERKIIVGSNRWQSVHTFNDLKIPEDDKNIILSFHFYHPFPFTHHLASWTGIKDYQGPVHYPGQIINEEDLQGLDENLRNQLSGDGLYYTRDSMVTEISKALKYAQKLGLPLYCGEFGVYPTVEEEDFIRWYTDIRSILEEKGIAWANWDYKGGFGIVDGQRNVRTNLVKALIPNN